MAYVYGTAGDDVIHGDDDSDSTGNDTLWGLGGNDRLYGHDGASDYLIGGAGADIIDGGDGPDMTDYRDSDEGVVIDLAKGWGYGGTAESDRLYSIEHVIGSNHNDTLLGTEKDDFFEGSDGADTLKGAGGADSLYGGKGDDTLKGGGGADVLHGGEGFDTVGYQDSTTGVFVSLITNTAAFGDAEGDTYTFIENVTGSAHNDNLWGHNGANALNGMAGNDSLKGYGGADTLIGETGDDILDGGTGIDVMVGGKGSDLFFVDSAYDTVTERAGEGSDVVRASVSYRLASDAEVEVLTTTDHYGTDAINLSGNFRAEFIVGNDGANVITGGGGPDTLWGRAGNDQYMISDASAVVWEDSGAGIDRVFASVSYALGDGAEVEIFSTNSSAGTAAINLTGNFRANYILGNDGANIINGASGADTLRGNGGADKFLFNTTLGSGNIDVIEDFVPADDSFWLDNAVFTGLPDGVLAAGAFQQGTAAVDADDRIIYNNATGAVFFDADGVGGTAATQFATVTPGTTLVFNSFLVI